MTMRLEIRRCCVSLVVCVAFAAMLSVSSAVIPIAPAGAQDAQMVAEFRPVLARYGHWQRHPRWGEVWVPERRPPSWRPYQFGHWVYTDEWGWYWISADPESDWGWITYHYGRWLFEPPFGWMWIPGDDWAPAWVDWRQGDEEVGWVALPPDDVVETVREQPDYWVFVPTRELLAPRVVLVMLVPARRAVIFRRTVVVNRTVVIRDRRVVVNPGIAPGVIARAAGRPVRVSEVKPRVVAGTRGVRDAVEVRVTPGRAVPRGRVTVKETGVVQPAQTVEKPQPLGRGENGRLGERPPRAAQGATPPNAAGTPAPNAPLTQQPSPRTPATTPATPQNAPTAGRPREPLTTTPSRPPASSSPPPNVVRPLGPPSPPPAAVRPPAPPSPPPAAVRPPPPPPPPPAVRPTPAPALQAAPQPQLPPTARPQPAQPPAAARPQLQPRRPNELERR
jgi:hypothetical protein